MAAKSTAFSLLPPIPVGDVLAAIRGEFPRGTRVWLEDAGPPRIKLDAALWAFDNGLIPLEEGVDLVAQRHVRALLEGSGLTRETDAYLRALAQGHDVPFGEVQEQFRAALRREEKKVLGASAGPQNVGRLMRRQEPHNDAQGDYMPPGEESQ